MTQKRNHLWTVILPSVGLILLGTIALAQEEDASVADGVHDASTGSTVPEKVDPPEETLGAMTTPEERNGSEQRVKRQQARLELWKSLSRAFSHPAKISHPAQTELKNHAWRVARLRRIRHLAAKAGDGASQQRATILLAREKLRHHQRLASLLAHESEESAP